MKHRIGMFSKVSLASVHGGDHRAAGDGRKGSSWEKGLSSSKWGKYRAVCFGAYRIQREGVIHHSAVLPGDGFTYPVMPPHFFNSKVNGFN